MMIFNIYLLTYRKLKSLRVRYVTKGTLCRMSPIEPKRVEFITIIGGAVCLPMFVAEVRSSITKVLPQAGTLH
jgi:hypothetical protein